MKVNTYQPGQSVRFSVTIAVLQIPADPSTLTLNVVDPLGNATQYTSPTRDATGQWHQDVTLSSTPTLGLWTYYWTSVGTMSNQQGVSKPIPFRIDPLGALQSAY